MIWGDIDTLLLYFLQAEAEANQLLCDIQANPLAVDAYALTPHVSIVLPPPLSSAYFSYAFYVCRCTRL
ncbi:hypothetical protein EON64_11935 [archaeon]|nr:MAG: hypothetical protein EON64_11935 [archaeon]